MIKLVIIICASIYCSSSLEAQKEDYIWLFGYDNRIPAGHETYFFDFNIGSSPDSLRGLSQLAFFGNNASICDAEGNLLFYTNGCHVADRNHNIMSNGSGINEGGNFIEFFRQDTCSDYPGRQNILILNDPGNEVGYYLLHKRVEFEAGELFFEKLLFSYIDLSLGDGDVIEKNQIIIDSSLLLLNYLTAIKHSNKEDWWILQISQDEKIKIFLLDSNGFNLNSDFELNVSFIENSSGSGTAKFSPDGSKYVFFNPYDNLHLYDFDRSSGELSNLIQLEILDVPDDIARFSSVEWSPDSRFIYVASQDVLYQVDTWEDNLEDGLVLIDTWNGVQDPFNTTFNLMASAPDCKIYMCSGSSTNTYHVINKPNEKGSACDFVQQGIRLPFVSATATMPNFPRFRVDEEDKCDPTITSIFGDHVYYRRDMTVYPNPVRDILTVEIPDGKKGRIVVFDMEGRVVWSGDGDGYSGEVRVDLSSLSVGTYSVEFLPEDNKERLVFTAQVVKVE